MEVFGLAGNSNYDKNLNCVTQNCFGQNFWTQNPKTEFLIENHNSGKILVSFNQNFIFQGLIALLDLAYNKFQPF